MAKAFAKFFTLLFFDPLRNESLYDFTVLRLTGRKLNTDHYIKIILKMMLVNKNNKQILRQKEYAQALDFVMKKAGDALLKNIDPSAFFTKSEWHRNDFMAKHNSRELEKITLCLLICAPVAEIIIPFLTRRSRL